MDYQTKEAASITATMEKFWVNYQSEKDPDLRHDMAREMVAVCRIRAKFNYGDARRNGCGTDLAILEHISNAIGVTPRSGTIITVVSQFSSKPHRPSSEIAYAV